MTSAGTGVASGRIAMRAAQLALAGLALVGCATVQAPGTGGANPPPLAAVGPGGAASGLRPPGAPPVPAVLPGALRPFAEVIKGAKRTEGLFRLLGKGRQGLARAEARGPRPALLSLAQAEVGHRRALLLRRPDQGQRHRRVPPHLQPGPAGLAKRRLHRQAGHARGAATAVAYSPSLLASTPVLSLPDPERKSVLVEPTRCSRRPARHRHGAAAQLSPGLRLRCPQLGDHERACHCRRDQPRGARPLRHGVDLGAAVRAARHAATFGARARSPIRAASS